MTTKEDYDRDFEQKIEKHKELKVYDAFILKRLQKSGKLKILVCGCGGGELARVLSLAGHDVTAIDISEKAIEHAKKVIYPAGYVAKVNWICADLEKPETWKDFKVNEFDMGIIAETLEHLYHPFYVLSELESICRDIIWTTPWQNRAGDNLHLHWFDYEPIYLDGFGINPVFALVEFRKNWVAK
jgi:2-polyprenyl-3-methyl-5-hydroxy-6-metoxy-1,4-benzoquinol methylase